MASPKSLRLCSFFLILLAFCSTDWIIAVTLSASLLNLSSACSYLLLSLSTEFPEFWRSWFWSFLLLFFFPLMVERIFRGLCHFHWCQLFLVFKGIVFAMQVADISVCLAFSNDSGFCYFVWNISIVELFICVKFGPQSLHPYYLICLRGRADFIFTSIKGRCYFPFPYKMQLSFLHRE